MKVEEMKEQAAAEEKQRDELVDKKYAAQSGKPDGIKQTYRLLSNRFSCSQAV
jgi:hypothetical protein